MRRIICALSLVGGLAVATPGLAQGRSAAADQQSPAFADGAVLGDADLGTVAGREDRGTQIAAADQRNTVSNNSVTGNSVTGSVTIDGHAFSNLSGLAVISANSGNNVAINSAMNVVINLGPQ
ncbi:hypothetical protein [Sphingomonas beigongshangi]|jgi:hypothetical protein|uniref:hypothetical protein n=1 Tax=Sphingomonas beigongshangi TaxID=2782540 RepID=UPI001AED224E|nr:hypothetical protein [Sphingomonas beigongshangi]